VVHVSDLADAGQRQVLMGSLLQLLRAVTSSVEACKAASKQLSRLLPGQLESFVAQDYMSLEAVQALGGEDGEVRAMARESLGKLLGMQL
jgi:hypothetical protein